MQVSGVGEAPNEVQFATSTWLHTQCDRSAPPLMTLGACASDRARLCPSLAAVVMRDDSEDQTSGAIIQLFVITFDDVNFS